MITATFIYSNSLSTSIVEFPKTSKGLRKEGLRPVKCNISGRYEHENEDHVRHWITASIRPTLDKDGIININIAGTPFPINKKWKHLE